MFCCAYVLASQKNDQLYIGYTTNLKRRLTEHNNGLNRSTRPYRPWNLAYYEAHLNVKDAQRREKCLKTTQGSRALCRMLREQFVSSRQRG